MDMMERISSSSYSGGMDATTTSFSQLLPPPEITQSHVLFNNGTVKVRNYDPIHLPIIICSSWLSQLFTIKQQIQLTWAAFFLNTSC